MIIVDTTVLVYAVGADHPLREPCRRLVSCMADGQVRATTTPEVIQEFAHVRSRRRGRDDAYALASRYADLLTPLLETQDRHLRMGLGLWQRHSELGCFDAVLAAVAMASGRGVVVSADVGFAAIEGLEHTLPDAEGVDRLTTV